MVALRDVVVAGTVDAKGVVERGLLQLARL